MASSGSAQYTYDATDQRVEKMQGSNSSEYVYCAGHPVATLKLNSDMRTDLIWAGANLLA